MEDINLKETSESINNKLVPDIEFEQLRKEVRKSFDNYRTTMLYMMADAPIEVLCLPTRLTNVLIDQGFRRIYDLLNVDLVKIKGIGPASIKQLTARLDEFLTVRG